MRRIVCPKCKSKNIRLASTVPYALSECYDCKHLWRQKYKCRNKKPKKNIEKINVWSDECKHLLPVYKISFTDREVQSTAINLFGQQNANTILVQIYNAPKFKTLTNDERIKCLHDIKARMCKLVEETFYGN